MYILIYFISRKITLIYTEVLTSSFLPPCFKHACMHGYIFKKAGPAGRTVGAQDNSLFSFPDKRPFPD